MPARLVLPLLVLLALPASAHAQAGIATVPATSATSWSARAVRACTCR